MKSPTVTSIDSFSIKAEIKKCPIDVQQYISALERSLERQKDVTNEAIKKIKELSSKAPEKEEEKWISVEDELPKTGIPVIIYGINDYGKSRRLRAFYAPKFSIDADCYEGEADYSEEKDEYFIPEGWYEQNEYEDVNWFVGFKPTHWQPLPEPPKN